MIINLAVDVSQANSSWMTSLLQVANQCADRFIDTLNPGRMSAFEIVMAVPVAAGALAI